MGALYKLNEFILPNLGFYMSQTDVTVSLSKYAYVSLLEKGLAKLGENLEAAVLENNRFFSTEESIDMIMRRLKSHWMFDTDALDIVAERITQRNIDNHPKWKFWSKPERFYSSDVYSFNMESYPDAIALFEEFLVEHNWTRPEVEAMTPQQRSDLVYQVSGWRSGPQYIEDDIEDFKSLISSVKLASNDTMWNIPQEQYQKLLSGEM